MYKFYKQKKHQPHNQVLFRRERRAQPQRSLPQHKVQGETARRRGRRGQRDGESGVQPRGTCFGGAIRRPDRPLCRGLGAVAAAAAGGPVLEDEQPHQVDGQPQGTDDEHQLGVVDALGPGEAQHGFHEDGEAEGGEEDGVAEGAHRLGPAVAIGGAGASAGAAGDAPGGQPHAERDEVRQHVERVGYQRDGVAHVARHQLGREEAGGQHQHEDEAARLPRVPPHGGRHRRPSPR